jgi:AcrR family transcriptional regulator
MKKRATKPPEERRAEIVQASRKLFLKEGFSDVAVSRIVSAVGVAQGTFYYYFATKEEVLDAVIEEYVQDIGRAFDAILANEALQPRAALQLMVRTELGFDARRARELYSIKGGDVHTRLFARVTAVLAPRYHALIKRGIERGELASAYPDLVAETILLHLHFLFDRDVLGWSAKKYARRVRAAERLFEVLLEIPAHGLDFHSGASAGAGSKGGRVHSRRQDAAKLLS